MTAIKKVLLAEDDRFLRRACATALGKRGFVVLLAEDGEQALEVARRELPALVLLDLLMPKMTGIEVLRALHEDVATRHIPIVILSNSSRELEMRDARELGAVDYLVKANLSLQALGDRVAQLLGE
jgi:CheY-like chemotaxis protein